METNTFKRMLHEAREKGRLIGSIQMALIDLKYNRNEMAIKVLTDALEHALKKDEVAA